MEVSTLNAGESVGGVVMALNPKQQKACQAELRALKEAFGAPLLELRDKFAACERLEAETDAEDRQVPVARLADSRRAVEVLRRAGAGRQHDQVGLEPVEHLVGDRRADR